MFIKVSLCGVLTLLSTTSAFALTCINDYGGTSSCTNANPAGDCETLGYSKDNVSGCEHYLYCPFDTAYKRCVSEITWTCPDGYSDELTSVNQCGTSGSNGWSLSTTTVEASNGSQVTCGKCTALDCRRPSPYQSIDDCGTRGALGWNFTESSTIYHGDEPCGTCHALSCDDGFSIVWQSVADCGTSAGYGWNFVTKGFNGDSPCGKCTAKNCPSGYATSCGSNQIAEEAPRSYAGDDKCYKCTSCPEGYFVSNNECIEDTCTAANYPYTISDMGNTEDVGTRWCQDHNGVSRYKCLDGYTDFPANGGLGHHRCRIPLYFSVSMKSIYDSKEYKTRHQWGFSCKNPTNRQVLAITINVGGQDITVTCDGVTSTINSSSNISEYTIKNVQHGTHPCEINQKFGRSDIVDVDLEGCDGGENLILTNNT